MIDQSLVAVLVLADCWSGLHVITVKKATEWPVVRHRRSHVGALLGDSRLSASICIILSEFILTSSHKANAHTTSTKYLGRAMETVFGATDDLLWVNQIGLVSQHHICLYDMCECHLPARS